MRTQGTNPRILIETPDRRKLSNLEKQTIDKALRLLRDRHYNNYARAKNPQGDVAKTQYKLYQAIDQLRGKVFDL